MKTTTSLALGLVLVTTSGAQSIFWGSDAFGNQYRSDGTTALSDEGGNPFTFQIGTFAGGVDPTAADANQLSKAWRVLDESAFSEEFVLFDSKANLDENGFSNGLNAAQNYDFRGQKLYIWVYDGKAPAEDNQTEVCHEWALFTGDWTVPNSADQTTLPLEYRTSTADSGAPIYGGLNNLQASDGGTFTAPTEVFELQTHEICLEAIPEPGGVLLLVMGTGICGLRRKRC